MITLNQHVLHFKMLGTCSLFGEEPRPDTAKGPFRFLRPFQAGICTLDRIMTSFRQSENIIALRIRVRVKVRIKARFRVRVSVRVRVRVRVTVRAGVSVNTFSIKV